MAVFASDGFLGTEGTELTAYNAAWIKPSYVGSTRSIRVASEGRVRANSSETGDAIYYYNTAPASADYDVEADIIASTNAERSAGVVGRVNPTTQNFYLAQFQHAQGWRLFKCVGGTFTQLGSTVSATLTNWQRYRMRLSMAGTTIKLFIDDAEVISVTDSGVTAAGYPGIVINAIYDNSSNNGYWLGDFAALQAGGSPPQGTVTISDVNPGETSAVVTYSYDDTDQTGFEYRLDGGTAASLGASPATISGLTASTEYDLEVRAINANGAGSWSAVATFTTDAVVLPTVTVADPLKNNTGTLLASQSGIVASVLAAPTLASVHTLSGLTTNGSGLLAPISHASLTTGQQYHVAIKLADGSVGITGPITAS